MYTELPNLSGVSLDPPLSPWTASPSSPPALWPLTDRELLPGDHVFLLCIPTRCRKQCKTPKLALNS